MSRVLLGTLIVGLLALGLGLAVAGSVPRLEAGGPTAVGGVERSAQFQVGVRTVRQVRYDGGATVAYTFRLTNNGPLPLDVLGLSDLQPESRMFTLRSLRPLGGPATAHLGVGETARFTLRMTMWSCATASRAGEAGGWVGEVRVHTEQVGVFSDQVLVQLPEELRTGSGRTTCGETQG